MKLSIATASILLVSLLAGAPAEVSAPGTQELHKLYGEPIMERFAVRSGISLTVEYGRDHKACQFLIAPEQLLVEVRTPGPPMSSQGVSAVLEQILPVATRGRQIDSATDTTNGGTVLTTEYEDLSIRRICSAPSCVSSSENQDVRTLVVFKRDTCPKHIE
jgi:hypothetical protein